MSLRNLVRRFEKMGELGYCEEDILDAFIDYLNQLRTSEEDDVQADVLLYRIESLRKVATSWINQNLLGDNL